MRKIVAILMAIIVMVSTGLISVSAMNIESPVATQSFDSNQTTTNEIITDNSSTSPLTGEAEEKKEQYKYLLFIIAIGCIPIVITILNIFT